MKSTKEHDAFVTVRLALIEGQWQLQAGDDKEVVTGSRHCKSVECEYEKHPTLPSISELTALLMEARQPQYVCILQYEDAVDSRHPAYTVAQADAWAREHVFECGFESAEVRDTGGRTLVRHELPDNWRETADV